MKKRLDELLTERGIFPSKSRSKAEIMEGNVVVDGIVVSKAGKFVDEKVEILIKKRSPYVSRGAYKLLKALDDFRIDLNGKVCYDFGASTGGFTHVMLERGARKVYSVDVGYGQLAWKLRNDPRVIVKERTNVRFLTPEEFDEVPDFISCDLSFISLRLILPVVRNLLNGKGEAICLIKPQFEAGRERTKKGVVRSKEVHVDVLEKVLKFAREIGFSICGLTYSPLKGPAGNVEFLVFLNFVCESKFNVRSVVDSAWKRLLEG